MVKRKVVQMEYNILWITCDEMRASAVSCYGNHYVSMPAIDRLAREGALFEQTYVQVPKCIPSRSLMLNGRYGHVDGFRTMSRRDFSGDSFMLLGSRDHSLVRWLKDAGYTLGLTGKNHIVRFSECNDLFESIPSLRVPEAPQYEYASDICRKAYFEGRVKSDYNWESFRDTIQADRIINFLERNHKNRFFALVDIGEPHPLYKEWPGLLDGLAIDTIPVPPRQRFEYASGPIRAWRESHDIEALSDTDRQRILRAYWTQCMFADRLVGRILDAVDRLGLAENTLVVWCADHGDFAGMYGCFEKWDTALYDCITHIPLIMRLPSVIPEQKRISALTESIDIAPTILDILDMPIPATINGKSMCPLLKGDEITHKEAVFCQGGIELSAVTNPGKNYMERLLPSYWGKQRTLIEHPKAIFRAHMVRTETHKLIYRLTEDHELYDLQTDPEEMENRYGDESFREIQEDLERSLLRFFVEYQNDQPSIEELWA